MRSGPPAPMANRMDIAERYVTYADHIAVRSPIVAELARSIAADDAVLPILDTLQVHKRRPSMVIAVLRMLYGQLEDWPALRTALLADPEPLLTEVSRRTVNMTEPARLAPLLPILASIPGPIALIDVGASLGLCLLPDRYSYRFSGRTVPGQPTAGIEAPVFDCEVNSTTPMPAEVPDIAFRVGLDLHPLDPHDEQVIRWLEYFIWPEEHARLERFRQCVAIARQVDPPVVKGDMRRHVPAILERIPAGLTPVVLNCGTARYLSTGDRELFAASMQSLPVRWISAESSRVFPGIARKVVGHDRRAEFLLALDANPLGWGSLMGDWARWFVPEFAGAG